MARKRAPISLISFEDDTPPAPQPLVSLEPLISAIRQDGDSGSWQATEPGESSSAEPAVETREMREDLPVDTETPVADGQEGEGGDGGDAAPVAPADRQEAKQLSLSKNGLEFIKGFERLRNKKYVDSAGHPTIGYGHKLLPGETEKFRNRIDENTALQLLAKDAKVAEDAVNGLVKKPLTQQQYDALVSLVYNIGVEAFRKSKALKQLNSANYAGAAKEIAEWRLVKNPKTNKREVSRGLVTRRSAELRIFGGGPYGIDRKSQ